MSTIHENEELIRNIEKYIKDGNFSNKIFTEIKIFLNQPVAMAC